MDRNLLVVGAREQSLGEAISMQAKAATYIGGEDRWTVKTAGISGEDIRMKLGAGANDATLQTILAEVRPHAVVCTVGINPPSAGHREGWGGKAEEVFDSNFHGPMHLLWNWLDFWRLQDQSEFPLSWAGISSNSAHVARSRSMIYCASKAALSMGLRCVAREMAGGPFSIYGYEPGWLDGTPMSEEKLTELVPKSIPPHRIPGGNSVDTWDLAGMIVANLSADRHLNGCMLRVDGGEQ